MFTALLLLGFQLETGVGGLVVRLGGKVFVGVAVAVLTGGGEGEGEGECECEGDPFFGTDTVDKLFFWLLARSPYVRALLVVIGSIEPTGSLLLAVVIGFGDSLFPLLFVFFIT